MKSLGMVLLLLSIFLGGLPEEALNHFPIELENFKNESTEIEAENSGLVSLVIYLPVNRSTGYDCVYAISDLDLMTLSHRKYQSISDSPLMGSGEILCLKFTTTKEQSGSVTLTLSCQRLWEAAPIEQRVLELMVDPSEKVHILSVSSEKID